MHSSASATWFELWMIIGIIGALIFLGALIYFALKEKPSKSRQLNKNLSDEEDK